MFIQIIFTLSLFTDKFILIFKTLSQVSVKLDFLHIHALCVCFVQAFGHRPHASIFSVDPVRSQNNVSQIGHNVSRESLCRVIRQLIVNHTVPKAECRRRKDVPYHRFELGVISGKISRGFRFEVKPVHDFISEDFLQILMVGYVLNHSPDNFTGLLEERFVIPICVHPLQIFGYPVMFPVPNSLERNQCGLLVDSSVPL